MNIKKNILRISQHSLLRSIATDLSDSFGRKHRYLRIALTEKCNLRCQYCMPECGVKLTHRRQLLTATEVQRLAEILVGSGRVDKIRLTGGEPTIRKDIVDIVGALSSITGVNSLGMTSNGIATGRLASRLKRAGLDAINISLDTLQETKYGVLTRRRGLNKVLSSIDSCLDAGIETVKINCVLMKGVNDDEIIDFVNLTKNKPLDIRFIEYMPFDGNAWSTHKLVSYARCVDILKQHFGGDMLKLADPLNHTAKAWKINGFQGKLGFITSMTEHFCSGCDRIRLTADGNLKVCLFGNEEVSLRDALREGANDTEIVSLVNAALKKKAWKHAGMENLAKMKNRPMILIGG